MSEDMFGRWHMKAKIGDYPNGIKDLGMFKQGLGLYENYRVIFDEKTKVWGGFVILPGEQFYSRVIHPRTKSLSEMGIFIKQHKEGLRLNDVFTDLVNRMDTIPALLLSNALAYPASKLYDWVKYTRSMTKEKTMDIQITTSEDRKLWKGCFAFGIHHNKWSTVRILMELEKTIKLRKHSPYRGVAEKYRKDIETNKKLDEGTMFWVRFDDVDIKGKDYSGSVKKFVKDYEHLFVMAIILGASVRCYHADNETGAVTYLQRKVDHLVKLKNDDDFGDLPTD